MLHFPKINYNVFLSKSNENKVWKGSANFANQERPTLYKNHHRFVSKFHSQNETMMYLLSNSENKFEKRSKTRASGALANTLRNWRERLCPKSIIDSFPCFTTKMKLWCTFSPTPPQIKPIKRYPTEKSLSYSFLINQKTWINYDVSSLQLRERILKKRSKTRPLRGRLRTLCATGENDFFQKAW